MTRKSNPDNWDWEKKPKKIEKGTNKTGKHRKSIYNMLSDSYDEDDYFDAEFDSDVNVSNNRRYVKR
jgi:hypothetical protein